MGKRDAMRDMIQILLDFDPAEIGPDDCLRGWKEIADAVGFSPDTLQRITTRFEVRLPRWGRPGPTTPVFLPRSKIIVLRRIVMNAF